VNAPPANRSAAPGGRHRPYTSESGLLSFRLLTVADEAPPAARGEAGAAPMASNNAAEERIMARGKGESVYRVTEIIGSSPTSWEDAAKRAVETAAKTLRDLRVAEVSKLDMKVENGKVVAYRARIMLSFRYGA
jgi:hypothetical protein